MDLKATPRRVGPPQLLASVMVVALITILLSMTVQPLVDEAVGSEAGGLRVPVWERINMPYQTDGAYGFVLEEGPYEPLATENEWNSTHVFVDFELPLTEGGSAAEGPKISLAYWRPDVPEGVTVPVIVEIGPYFQEPSVETPTIEVPGSWLGEMMVEQLLPHGYAFAQVSVTGTGRSNHCMDLMGFAEQEGVNAAVSWLGEQAWSNGGVALIGKSYDGSTPWQAAMYGNEALKTIVPISGLIGVKELMWRNGSAEARAPIMHNGVYGSYGLDGDEEDYQNICPDYLIGPGTGVSAYVFGSEVAGDYWEERYFLDRVLENYKGSVYLIQGMHDWNVDPHMAVPTMNRLIDAGIEARGLFGQWDHDYPDRPIQLDDRSDLGGRGGEAFPLMVRYDWMQDLHEWFDYYLKGIGPQPGQWIEVQSNLGQWRLEYRYPPEDAVEQRWELGTELTLESGGLTVFPDATSGPIWISDPVPETLHLVGTPRLHVEVRTATVGGQLYALLESCNESGACIHVGHAIMDLRYHAGGDEIQSWAAPLASITALMEFMPLDATVPEGHTLRLSLRSTGEDYLPATTSSVVTVIEGESSTLQLDLVDIENRLLFEPPVCLHERCLMAA